MRKRDTDNLQIGQASSATLPEFGEDSEIAIGGGESPDGPTFSDYAAALAFMEEPVTIVVGGTGSKDDELLIQCSCNGSNQFVIRGKEQTIKRKYLESLVRGKPVAVSTRIEGKESDNPTNFIDQSYSLKNPISIRRDSAKGMAWFEKICAEN